MGLLKLFVTQILQVHAFKIKGKECEVKLSYKFAIVLELFSTCTARPRPGRHNRRIRRTRSLVVSGRRISNSRWTTVEQDRDAENGSFYVIAMSWLAACYITSFSKLISGTDTPRNVSICSRHTLLFQLRKFMAS